MKRERTEVGLTGRYVMEFSPAAARDLPVYSIYDTDDDALVGFGSREFALGLVDRLEQEYLEAERETP